MKRVANFLLRHRFTRESRVGVYIERWEWPKPISSSIGGEHMQQHILPLLRTREGEGRPIYAQSPSARASDFHDLDPARADRAVSQTYLPECRCVACTFESLKKRRR